MQTNRKTVNEQKEDYNSSRYSGLPRFPGSLSILSVPPHHIHVLHTCSSMDQYLHLRPPGPWAARATLSTAQRIASTRGFTSQLDFVQRQTGEQGPQSSSHHIGIMVSCHSESRVPLKDLPSESLLPETTPVLGFFPFPILFTTLLLVFLGVFFWKLSANEPSSQDLLLQNLLRQLVPSGVLGS